MVSVWQNKYLLYMVTKNQIDTLYRGSALGLFWAFFTPLLLMGVYTAVFGFIFQGRFGEVPNEGRVEYALGLFCGLNVFYFFSEIVAKAPTLITSNPNFVKKVIFPLELFPVATIAIALFHFSIATIPLILALLLVQGGLFWTALLLPLPVAILAILALGLSYIFSALGVFLKDLQNLVGILITVLLFASAVFYSLDAIPGVARIFVEQNPLAQIVINARRVLVFGLQPDYFALGQALVVSLLIWAFGRQFFLAAKPHFSDYL